MAVGYFTWRSFLGRSLAVFVLVLLTYNPTGFSFVQWLVESLRDSRAGAAHALAGVVVAIGWVFVLRATLRSLGIVGLVLGAAFFGALVWFLISLGVLQLGARSAITWAALLCLAGLLAIGISWSHVRRRVTGQVDVDDIDAP
jgi:Family of unknown function (DUF6524)